MEKVYTTLKHLGRGTFGDVYLCEKVHNKQKVVIKKIECNPEVTNSSDLLKAKNEAQILKKLQHPNIIRYFDSSLKGNVYHIVMEYAIQGTLYEYIKSQQSVGKLMPREWVLLVFVQILLGLDYVHQKSIIHRDLKCENIFMTGADGCLIKIGDFGISKMLRNNETTMTSIGTPNYLAPEICDGSPYDQRSDVWSLGCVLFETCSLYRLFDGPVSKVIHEIKGGLKQSINISLYGRKLQQILESLLQVDPNQRPTTKQLFQYDIVFQVYATLIIDMGNAQTVKHLLETIKYTNPL